MVRSRIGQVELKRDRLEELENAAASACLQNELEGWLRRRSGLLEAVLVEPVSVPHLNEPLRRVAHEHQFAVTEAICEVRKERRLATIHPERIVHEATRLGLIGESGYPRRPQRLLPGVREVETVTHLAASGPEDHALYPCPGVRGPGQVARR